LLECRRRALFAGFTEKRLAKFMPFELMVLAMLRIGSTCRLGWSFSGNPAWVAEMLGLPTQPTALPKVKPLSSAIFGILLFAILIGKYVNGRPE
jgi:hypothetical protein